MCVLVKCVGKVSWLVTRYSQINSSSEPVRWGADRSEACKLYIAYLSSCWCWAAVGRSRPLNTAAQRRPRRATAGVALSPFGTWQQACRQRRRHAAPAGSLGSWSSPPRCCSSPSPSLRRKKIAQTSYEKRARRMRFAPIRKESEKRKQVRDNYRLRNYSSYIVTR